MYSCDIVGRPLGSRCQHATITARSMGSTVGGRNLRQQWSGVRAACTNSVQQRHALGERFTVHDTGAYFRHGYVQPRILAALHHLVQRHTKRPHIAAGAVLLAHGLRCHPLDWSYRRCGLSHRLFCRQQPRIAEVADAAVVDESALVAEAAVVDESAFDEEVFVAEPV